MCGSKLPNVEFIALKQAKRNLTMAKRPTLLLPILMIKRKRVCQALAYFSPLYLCWLLFTLLVVLFTILKCTMLEDLILFLTVVSIMERSRYRAIVV